MISKGGEACADVEKNQNSGKDEYNDLDEDKERKGENLTVHAFQKSGMRLLQIMSITQKPGNHQIIKMVPSVPSPSHHYPVSIILLLQEARLYLIFSP